MPACHAGPPPLTVAPVRTQKHIKKGVVTTLVLAPTRELAIQTQVVTATVAPSVGAHSVCVYGGDPKHVQLRQLQEKGGANVIIATPGRLLDLAEIAVGETVIFLAPLSPSLLKRLLKGEGGPAE